MDMKINARETSTLGIPSTDSIASTSDDGNICSSAPEHFLRAFGLLWGSVFALQPSDRDLPQRVIADHTAHFSWELSLMVQPNLDMAILLKRI